MKYQKLRYTPLHGPPWSIQLRVLPHEAQGVNDGGGEFSPSPLPHSHHSAPLSPGSPHPVGVCVCECVYMCANTSVT